MNAGKVQHVNTIQTKATQLFKLHLDTQSLYNKWPKNELLMKNFTGANSLKKGELTCREQAAAEFEGLRDIYSYHGYCYDHIKHELSHNVPVY